MMKNKVIYALGYFDGVHLGHQALLNACRNLASHNRTLCGAVTFSVHPQQLLTGAAPLQINTNAQRKDMLLKAVDTVIELEFTDSLMAMPWHTFLNMLTEDHNAVGFVCGSDFRFGKSGEGTAQLLENFCQKNNLYYQIVPQQYLDHIRVSSTHIRRLLEQGDIPAANRFLGHPHKLTGIVQSGKQLGRTLGFPTANLSYPDGLLKLPFGVYACLVLTEGKSYTAVTNIGVRPTVSGEGITVETHLLHYTGDLYGKHLEIQFFEHLRPEHKFDNLSSLQKQVEKDKFLVEKVMQNI